MTILNGTILAVGGLLMALPIVIHLLMRPRPKPITFPALQFVIPIQRTNKRQLRVKNWLLLFLRCLAILAVAAALARPSVASNVFGAWLTLSAVAAAAALVAFLLAMAVFWIKPFSMPLVTLLSAALVGLLVAVIWLGTHVATASDQAVLGDQSAPVAAVILVDNSPRTGYRVGNQTLLERSQELGDWLISQLPLASQVSIATPDGDDPFFSVDLNAARKRLSTLQHTYRDVSIPEALLTALDLVASSEMTRKEIYILTDLTQSSWPVQGDRLAQKLSEQTDTSVYLLDVGVEQPVNIRLQPLQLASSAITPAGRLELQARIESEGVNGSRVVNLFVEQPDLTRPVRRDGQTLLPTTHWQRSASVDLADDKPADVSFELGQLPPGVHHGWVEIEGDDPLSIDNRRNFTIEVRPAWKTLVVHPEGVSPENFVQTVSPTRLREMGTAEFACDVIDQRELSSRAMADYRLVALLDPAPMSEGVWQEIRRFVEQGGGLLVALGHNAANAGVAHPSFRSNAAMEVLPGELTEVWRAPEGDVFLSPTDFGHPILAEFRERASTIRWNLLPIYLHWGLQPPPSDGGDPINVLLRYSNRRPAMLERSIGRGRAIVMTTPVTDPPRPIDYPSWNALFYGTELWASWLLVWQTANYLVQTESQALNVEVDQTITLPNDSRTMPTEYWLFSPRDEEPLKVVAENNQVRYRFTNVPGNYRLRGSGPPVVLRGFSVNLRRGATRLERCDKEQLDELLGQGRYRLARGRTEIEREQGVARIGQEFYPLLTLAVALLLGLEFLLATLFYRTSRSGAATRSASTPSPTVRTAPPTPTAAR